MNALRNRALQLEAHGLAPFPLTKHKKIPIFGYKELVTPEKSAERQAKWEKYEDRALTGIFTRMDFLPEGCVLLDLDFTEEKHHLEFAALLDLDLDAVLKARSPRGGLHLYLRYPRPLNLPTQANVTFSDGAIGPLDIRCRGKGTGAVMPGSAAHSKALGKVGTYEALGEGAEDAIFNLQWTQCTEEQQQKLEEHIGLKAAPSATDGNADRLACDAFGDLIATGVSQLTAGEFDTNDTATWFGNMCGAVLRTDAMPSALAEDCWAVLLSKATASVREQFEGDPRHKTSFITNAITSIELTQQQTRTRIAAAIAEAKSPEVVHIEDPFEKVVYEFFGGAVGVILDHVGNGTFGLLPGAGYARLTEDDWDHPETVKLDREPVFGGGGNLDWLTSLLLHLGMQSKSPPKRMDAELKDWLIKHCLKDESDHLGEIKQLQHDLKQFDRGAWINTRERLPENQKSRWLWFMAKGDRTTAFVALVDNEVCIAVPPRCKLSAKTMELLGDPIGSRTNPRNKKIHIYEVPEEVKDDQAA